MIYSSALKQTTITTKGLTRKTIAVHGRYKSFISSFTMGVVICVAVVVTKEPNGLGSSLTDGSTRDLRWVVKRTCMQLSSLEHVAKKKHSRARLSRNSLANKRLLDATRLACKFDLDQGIPRWAHVITSQRKSVHSRPGQTESQVNPSSQIASSLFDQDLFKSSLLSILVYSLKGG